MARREIPLLHGGSIADVAALEGEMRRRARLQESFGRRLPEPPAAILALLACDGAMAKANPEAIDRVGEIARGLDRTHRFAAGMETGMKHKVIARGQKRLANSQDGKIDARLLNF